MIRHRLARQLLRATVTYLAPGSRALAPSSNNIIASSGQRTQPRFLLEFATKEGRKAAHAWYEYQGSNTRFTSLEYRKDRTGRFKHEFIVVRLNETTLCRFDRRAQYELRGHALKDEGTAAEDSAHVICSFETEYHDLVQQSEVLLKIDFPDGEDLKLILAICFGIQNHPRASSYTLLRYNCYFFCWTIVVAVTRRALPWEGIGISSAVQDEVAAILGSPTIINCENLPPTIRVPKNVSKFIQFARRLIPGPLLSPQAETSDVLEVQNFWKHLINDLVQDLKLKPTSHLRKALLRSQLPSALAAATADLVKLACANAVALLVRSLVAEGCEPQSLCPFPVPAPVPPRSHTECGLRKALDQFQHMEQPFKFTGKTLIGHICSEATKDFFLERSKCQIADGNGSCDNCDSLSNCLRGWDAAWDAANVEYHTIHDTARNVIVLMPRV